MNQFEEISTGFHDIFLNKFAVSAFYIEISRNYAILLFWRVFHSLNLPGVGLDWTIPSFVVVNLYPAHFCT